MSGNNDKTNGILRENEEKAERFKTEANEYFKSKSLLNSSIKHTIFNSLGLIY